MSIESRNLFFNLLRSAVSTEDFSRRTTLLLECDPIYLPAYLEHIWFTDKSHDTVLERELLKYTKKVVRHLFTDSEAREQVINTWSQFELDALHELLQLHFRSEKSLFRRILIRMQQLTIETKFPIKNQLSPTTEYLRKDGQIDPRPLQAEVADLIPVWWNIYRVRAEHISYHQYTHAIILRKLVSHSQDYTPVEGVHESKATEYVERFTRIHSAVIEFAKTQNLGLGRVAIVRMPPGKQSYRHYDDETYLVGRKRYHLVVQAGAGNMLSSGSETIEAKPGDIWFFENHVMHRAHNKSKIPRLHVIFDGYPLS